METYEWPAHDYAIGSYIQARVASEYIKDFSPAKNAAILDIGCGDGAFSTKIAAKIPEGTLLGIDRSHNMIELAQEKQQKFPQFTAEEGDVLTMQFQERFDHVVSFWCLQWCTDLAKALNCIYSALRKEGRILLLLPTGDDPLVRGYRSLISSQRFPALNHFVPKIDFAYLQHFIKNAKQHCAEIGFKAIDVETEQHSLCLPSLDVFRKFVHGVAFFQGKVPDADVPLLNEAIV
jgi:ubiquinone/menaquinone biosynthesis C-methylase UbiE